MSLEFREITKNFVEIVALLKDCCVRGERDLMAAELMAKQTRLFCVCDPEVEEVLAIAIVRFRVDTMHVDAVQNLTCRAGIMNILYDGIADVAHSKGMMGWECRTQNAEVLIEYLKAYNPIILDTVLLCDVIKVKT